MAYISDKIALAEFSHLKFLEDFSGGEKDGVDDSDHSECSTDNGANICEETVKRLSSSMVSHSNWVEIVLEPDGWNDAASHRHCNITLVGICILVSHQCLRLRPLEHRWHNLHDVVMRFFSVCLAPVLILE